MRAIHLAIVSAIAIGISGGVASASPSRGTVVADAALPEKAQPSTIPDQSLAQTPAQTSNENLPDSKTALNPQPLPSKKRARVYTPGTHLVLNPQPFTPKIRVTGFAIGFRK